MLSVERDVKAHAVDAVLDGIHQLVSLLKRERPQAGGIVALAGQPPYKAGATLGQRIDLIELGHKIGHRRAFKRRAHAREVRLQLRLRLR